MGKFGGNFDDGEDTYEARLKLTEDQLFKVASRAAKQFGEWAAQQMNMTGSEAENYTMALVESDLSADGQKALLDRVDADFQSRSVAANRTRIDKEWTSFYLAAVEKIVGPSKLK
jgi:hypothetical protein